METLPIKVLNKKSENIVITAAYHPSKETNKLFKDFCKDFLSKQEMSNKAAFLLGGFNLNVLDYNTNELVKNFFNLIFQNGFLPLIQRPTRFTRTTAVGIERISTNIVLNKIQSGLSKLSLKIISQYSLF